MDDKLRRVYKQFTNQGISKKDFIGGSIFAGITIVALLTLFCNCYIVYTYIQIRGWDTGYVDISNYNKITSYGPFYQIAVSGIADIDGTILPVIIHYPPPPQQLSPSLEWMTRNWFDELSNGTHCWIDVSSQNEVGEYYATTELPSLIIPIASTPIILFWLMFAVMFMLYWVVYASGIFDEIEWSKIFIKRQKQ